MPIISSKRNLLIKLKRSLRMTPSPVRSTGLFIAKVVGSGTAEDRRSSLFAVFFG